MHGVRYGTGPRELPRAARVQPIDTSPRGRSYSSPTDAWPPGTMEWEKDPSKGIELRRKARATRWTKH
eukprot:4643332-Pyramimonas_sp.AAC.1